MSTFHRNVGGASSSEQQRWRASGIGIIIAAVCTLLLAGTGNAARRETPSSGAYSSVASDAFSPIAVPDLDRAPRSFARPLFIVSQSVRERIEPPALTDSEEAIRNVRAEIEIDGGPVELAHGLGVAEALTFLPNSEVIDSPNSKSFSASEFAAPHAGFLMQYREQVTGEWLNGAEIVDRVAINHSINPRLLLAVLEYRSGWVTDPDRPAGDEFDFPIRSDNRLHKGLYLQLSWTANALSQGYYGWKEAVRTGSIDASSTAETAGSAAIAELVRGLCPAQNCLSEFLATYERLFGDPWGSEIELTQENLVQPNLRLPFHGDSEWVLSGGPHGAWGPGAPWAAIDFAPKWDPFQRARDKEVVAVADALVARVNPGVVVLDLDGDGYEQTGWAILYLHVVAADGIVPGKSVRQGEVIGQASNVGGVSGGDHLHIARKYNGEWVPVVGRVPLELGTWRVRSGDEAYQGALYPATGVCDSAGSYISVGESVQPLSLLDCGASVVN